MPKRVLFVCSGNICRSPMAEGILRSVLETSGVEGVEVRSAGSLGFEGNPPAEHAVRACRERGIDIASLRSHALSPADVEWADIVLGMEEMHRRECTRLRRDGDARIELLGAYDPSDRDEIEDPIGRDLRAFRDCRDRIFDCVARFVRQKLA